MSSSSTAAYGAEEIEEKQKKKMTSPAVAPAGPGIFGPGMSNGSLIGITTMVWKGVFKSYGKTIATFFATFLVSGWALRQLALFFPLVERIVYSEGVPDPPPAELVVVWLVQMALRLMLHGLGGLAALVVIAFSLFVWDWIGSSGPTPNLAALYGEGSWAAVVTQPNDALGIAFCHELAAAKLNLLVISEGGMRDLCTTLHQTSGVQVQPFELPLSDSGRLARAWENYDLGVVVFVAPRAQQALRSDVTLENVESFFKAGVLGAQQAASAALPKLTGRASKDKKKAALVFATSVCGLFPIPGWTAQSVVDSSVVTLASSLSAELAPLGVGVLNAPCRGMRETDHDTANMRNTARSVLVGLSQEKKVVYGTLRNAAQAWTIGALPLGVKQQLAGQFSRSMAKTKEKQAKKSPTKSEDQSEDKKDDGEQKQKQDADPSFLD